MAINIVNSKIEIDYNDQTLIIEPQKIVDIKQNEGIIEYEYIAISEEVKKCEKDIKKKFSDFFTSQANAPYRPYLLDLMRIISWIESSHNIIIKKYEEIY